MRSLLLLLLLANSASAAQYVLPVATARYKDRIYTTTVALHNGSDRDVRCKFTHRPVNDPARILSSSEVIPAHENRVIEDFLMEVGAIGSVRIDCTGEIVVLSRIQDSLDDAKTFRDGRVFRGTIPTTPIVQGAPRSVTTETDLVLIEVLGKPAAASIVVKNAAGSVVAKKQFDLPPRAHQPVNLENVLPEFPVDITVSITGDGGVVVASATQDSTVGKLVLRMSPDSRARANEHFAQQERQAVTSSATLAAEAHAYGRSVIAPMASFKAAPFQEPATGLILMRDRWYDPSTGTFLTPDPEGYDDSSNPYIFGRGDPVNNSDPTGRHTFVKRKVNGLEFELLAPDPDEVRQGILGMSGSFTNPLTGRRESFVWDQHASELLLMQARWGNPLIQDAFAQFFGMTHDQVDVSGLRLYWNSLWHHKTDIALSAGFTVAMLAPEVRLVDPKTLRWTQRTAGGSGRADTLRASMGKGWSGEPIDVVATEQGLVTVDHTRAAVAIELNMTKVPVRIHLPSEPLPPEMLARPWGGGAKPTTWGEAAAARAAAQRPPLPPTGTPTPPRLPKPRGHQ